MDIGCIEVVVSRKPNTLFKFLRVLLIMLAVCFLFLGLVGIMVAFIPGIACLVGYYFVNMNVGIDYEYSYVERELRIAKIMNKERRKEIATYDLEKLEIMAPVKSWHLDSYNGRQIAKDIDYSSGEEKQPDPCYYLYLEGNTRLKLELEGEDAQNLIAAVKQMAPRKVYTD
ncbi:MAG: hypothetical protein IKF45_06585 [Lachnospiraceae bacterium]|nr:hypothetical protein [Lachnospiraceae bacterium]MBR2996361.1 hypothetical protein [Lachnospiraceae bacterium]